MRLERYYTRDGKTYAYIAGSDKNDKKLFCVCYNGISYKYEYHKINLYEWAKHNHGNVPGGTPYGWIKTTKTGKRIQITI